MNCCICGGLKDLCECLNLDLHNLLNITTIMDNENDQLVYDKMDTGGVVNDIFLKHDTYEVIPIHEIYSILHGNHRNPQGFKHRISNDGSYMSDVKFIVGNNGPYWLQNLLYCMIKEGFVSDINGYCDKDHIIKFVKMAYYYPDTVLPFTRECILVIKDMFGGKFWENLMDWLTKWCLVDDLLLDNAWCTPTLSLPHFTQSDDSL